MLVDSTTPIISQISYYNKYDKAAMLFSENGAAGEANAIAHYLRIISDITESSTKTSYDHILVENLYERIEDEINHLLGNTLDAIMMANLKIAPDKTEYILDQLRKAINYGESSKTPEKQETVNL